MDLAGLENISPFIRMVKIKKAVHLEGSWEDLDQLLIYIAQGSIDYIVEGTRYHFEKGDFIIIPPYMYHVAVKSNAELLVQYIVHFDFFSDPERRLIPHQSALKRTTVFSVLEQEKVLCSKPIFGSVCKNSQYDFEKIFMTMYQEYFQKRKGYQTMLKGLAIQLLTLLFREQTEFVDRETECGQKKIKSWKLVENALEFIYMHFDENLDNTKISEAVNVSPNYLSKLFQNFIGMSLHAYLLNYRLDKAQQLILSGKYNITEAAFKSGFSSIHTFSKTFKQKRGVSPSDYASQAENNKAVEENEPDYNLKKGKFFNV